MVQPRLGFGLASLRRRSALCPPPAGVLVSILLAALSACGPRAHYKGLDAEGCS